MLAAVSDFSCNLYFFFQIRSSRHANGEPVLGRKRQMREYLQRPLFTCCLRYAISAGLESTCGQWKMQFSLRNATVALDELNHFLNLIESREAYDVSLEPERLRVEFWDLKLMLEVFQQRQPAANIFNRRWPGT